MKPMTMTVVLCLCLVIAACQQQSSIQPTKEVIGNRMPDLPFSNVIRAGNTYYFAGKIGVDPATRQLTEGGTAEQTRIIMETFKKQFEELGLTFDNMVNATVYLTDINDYSAMNNVYKQYFKIAPPARACIGVKELVRSATVEISFIGWKAG